MSDSNKKKQASASKHWIGTLKKDDPNAKFWENNTTLQHIEYIKLQEEKGHGENGYEHYQIYMVLKQRKRLTWIKKHIHPTAHWEPKKGTVAEAIDYVSKEDTRVPGGITFEYGDVPREMRGNREDAIELAQTLRDKDDVKINAQLILTKINNGEFIKWEDIPADVQMTAGFMAAYNKSTRDRVGPERPDLQIVTIIGPPGCGKSYAISKLFPNAGKCIEGNTGIWFANAKSDVMVFEEFSGKVPLQNMLKYLDPYPLALEVKGGTEPAYYRLVIITSNTHPSFWYTQAEEFRQDPTTGESSAKRRRTDALAALWDRIGYKKLCRDNGHCYFYEIDPDNKIVSIEQQIQNIRDDIMQRLSFFKEALQHQDKPEEQVVDSEPLPDLEPEPEHEELNEDDIFPPTQPLDYSQMSPI